MARRTSLFTIFLVVFIDLVGFGMVLPNLQLYGQQFGITNYFALTLIGATYSLFQFVFAPILGTWSDHIGRRPVLLISQIGTFVGFMILFGANFFRGPDAWIGIIMIFGSRILDGISGGNISTANAYIADITTPENRTKGMALIGVAFGLGFVFGPLLGGLVGGTPALGVAYVPVFAGAFSLVAFLMTYFFLGESLVKQRPAAGQPPRRFSVRGLQHALQRPIVAPLIIMFFVNGFAFAGMEGTFSLLIQHRFFPIAAYTGPLAAHRVTPHPALGAGHKLLPPTGSAASSATAASTATQARRAADDHASRASGILFGCIGVVIVLFQGGFVRRLAKRYGEPSLVITGPLIIALGLIMVAIPVDWAWKWTGFAIGGGLLAIGSALFTPSLQSLISRHCAEHEQGEILGANQGMASLARALGPATAGVMFEWVTPETPYYFSAALAVMVSIGALMMGHRLRPPAPKNAAAEDDATAAGNEAPTSEIGTENV